MELRARSFAEVEAFDPEAIWPGFIFAGQVTVLAGAGGSGKSFASYDLAARVSTGRAMPDGSPGSEPGAVIIAGVEDSPEAAAVHRLTAAGADLSRIMDASESPSGAPFTLDDLPWLREVSDQAGGARLLTIDTLSAVVDRPLTGVAYVRQVMNGLHAFARDTGAGVLVIHHLTKAGEVAGSKAIVDSVRQVLTISKDPADPRVRTLQVKKSNVAADSMPGVRFMLTGEGRETTVRWLTTGADLGEDSGGRVRIAAVLREAGRAMTAQEIAMITGIRYATVRVQLHRMSKSGQVLPTGRNSYTVS